MKRFGLFLLAFVMVAGMSGCEEDADHDGQWNGGSTQGTTLTANNYTCEGIKIAKEKTLTGSYEYTVRGSVHNNFAGPEYIAGVSATVPLTGDIVAGGSYAVDVVLQPGGKANFEILFPAPKGAKMVDLFLHVTTNYGDADCEIVGSWTPK